MSLINDALKKTQRMRSDPADSGSAVVGGGYSGPRGRSSSGPSVGLMIGGGLLLVAIAVGGTILLLKSKSLPPASASVVSAPAIVPASAVTPPAVATAPAASASVASGLPSGPAPMIVLPKIETAPSAAPTTVAAAPAPELTAAPLPAPASTPATTANPAAKAKVDVATFIDAIHVTGVRFSEGSSKVLMNDHVYKVNDVVERVLNIKLIEVGTDSLTFIDENGAVYKKGF